MDVDKSGNNKSLLNRVHLEAELERLRRREALLDATEQVANIGHCEWDYENHCIKSCSDGYARIYNMSVIEICELQSNWGKVLEQVRPEDGTTAEALIRSADKAMYQVKHQGKNNFGFISVQNST